MYPAAIVKDLDVVEQLICCLSPRLEAFVMNRLTLQVAKETFAHGVVPTVAFAAHALTAVPRGESFAENCARLFAAAITVDGREVIVILNFLARLAFMACSFISRATLL